MLDYCNRWQRLRIHYYHETNKHICIVPLTPWLLANKMSYLIKLRISVVNLVTHTVYEESQIRKKSISSSTGCNTLSFICQCWENEGKVNSAKTHFSPLEMVATVYLFTESSLEVFTGCVLFLKGQVLHIIMLTHYNRVVGSTYKLQGFKMEICWKDSENMKNMVLNSVNSRMQCLYFTLSILNWFWLFVLDFVYGKAVSLPAGLNNLLLFSLLTKSWYSQFWEMIWSVGLDTLTTAVLQYSRDSMYVQFLWPLVTFLIPLWTTLYQNNNPLFPRVKSCATDDVVECNSNQTTRWTVFFSFSQRNKSLSLKPALAPLDNLFLNAEYKEPVSAQNQLEQEESCLIGIFVKQLGISIQPMSCHVQAWLDIMMWADVDKWFSTEHKEINIHLDDGVGGMCGRLFASTALDNAPNSSSSISWMLLFLFVPPFPV